MSSTANARASSRIVNLLPGLIVLLAAVCMFFYGFFGSRFRLDYLNESSDPSFFVQDIASRDILVSDTFDGPHVVGEAKLVEESTYEGLTRNHEDARYSRDVLVKMPRGAPRKACST